MFFIKKQFENIISWGVFGFCFLAGFSLFFYSFFVIYPLDQISEVEDQNIISIDEDVKVISNSFNFDKVKISVSKINEAPQIKQEEIKETKKTIPNKKIKIEKKEVKKNVKEKVVQPKKKIESVVGMASWYCPKWCKELAAAHSNYSKGTRLKVTNLQNKKSVIVIVNDFGPNKLKHPDRIIDLTKTAFQKIANIGEGEIKVKVEKL